MYNNKTRMRASTPNTGGFDGSAAGGSGTNATVSPDQLMGMMQQ